jgi:hypothetical protein
MQQAPMEAPPLQPAQSSQIQESNLLQQILASPEAIQVTLKTASTAHSSAQSLTFFFYLFLCRIY